MSAAPPYRLPPAVRWYASGENSCRKPEAAL